MLPLAYSSFSFGLWKVLSATVPGILNHMDLTFTTLDAVVQWFGIRRPCRSIPCFHSKDYSLVMNDYLTHYFMTTLASVGNYMLKCFFGFTATECNWILNPIS